jgi:broad specificity phosphatase PhoE
MATRLVLIRHGEANAFAERVVHSHNCTGLTLRGRRQATALRDRLAHTKELSEAGALCSSLMRRAIETAELVSPAIGDGSLALTTDCGFCEMHQGDGDGLSWEDFEARYGGFDRVVERGRAAAPGGESVDELVARAGSALRGLAERHDGATTVVVCHGGVVGAALEEFLGVAFGEVTRYVENTSLTELVQWDDGRWWLVRLNDAAHLLPVAPVEERA